MKLRRSIWPATGNESNLDVSARGLWTYSSLYRSAMECMGGHTAKIGYAKRRRFVAWVLGQVYRLNSLRRGDVLMILGGAQ